MKKKKGENLMGERPRSAPRQHASTASTTLLRKQTAGGQLWSEAASSRCGAGRAAAARFPEMMGGRGRGRGGGGGGPKPVEAPIVVPSGDLFRVYKTLLSMLHNRGYDIDAALRTMDKKRFDSLYMGHDGVVRKELLRMTVKRSAAPEDQLMVFWTDGGKVGVGPIRNFFDQLQAHGVKRGILVVENAVSPFGKQALATFRPTHVVEYFSYAELKFDITTHSMVPRHRVLSKEERKQLFESLQITPVNLPRMQPTDPVARYFGMDRMDVVEITRKSKETDTYVTYRIVLPA
jgi:DNA-directed RNA polymerase I, II, and III subunit RPABC1